MDKCEKEFLDSLSVQELLDLMDMNIQEQNQKRQDWWSGLSIQKKLELF